ncbi:MAG: hypothetical protein AB7V40_06480, partial [Methyloceanibacter sp.]
MEIGNPESPWRHQELLADREGCLHRLGQTLSAGLRVALRAVALLVQTLLVRMLRLRSRSVLRGRRVPGGLVCFRRVFGAPFALAMTWIFHKSPPWLARITAKASPQGTARIPYYWRSR